MKMKLNPTGGLLSVATGAALMLGTMPALANPFANKVYEGVEDLPTIRLTHSEWGPTENAGGQTVQKMIAWVNEVSNGKIIIEPFWNASLMSPPEHAAGIAAGLVDMGFIAPIYTPTDFPVADWLTSLGSLARDGAPFGMMAMTGAQWEFNITNEDYLTEMRDFGLEPLTGSTSTAYSMMCTKPMKTMADFDGARTRTTGNAYSEQVQALRMVPVPVHMNETYEALSRGIIDCMVFFTTGYIDNNIVDVPGDKYYINLEFPGVNGSLYAMNKDRWDDLPEVAQEIIRDAHIMRTELIYATELPRLRDLAAMINGDARVHAVHPDADVIAALRAKQDEQMANLVANAPRGVDNPQEILDHYMALTEKWRAIVSDDLGVEAVAATSVEDALAAWDNDPDWTAYAQKLADELGR